MIKSYFIITLLILNSLLITYPNIKAQDSEEYNIGIHYKYSGINNLAKDLQNIKNNGFKIIRTSFVWKIIEPSPNNFNFTYYDTLVNEASKLGLKIIAILGMGTQDMLPSWVKDVDDPNYINYLSQYAQAVTTRYSSKIEIWQIENELNHVGFYKWVGWRTGNWSFEKIHNILNTLSQIVRKNTNGKIMINVIVDNPNWLSFLKSINNIHYDIVGLDYYPNYLDDYSSDAGDPSKALKIYEYIKIAKQLGKDVIVTETGYSTYNIKHTEENQVAFIQNILKGALLMGVKDIVFYQYKDQSEGNDIESNFGLISYNGSPKQAWYEIGKLAKGIFLNINTKLDGLQITTPIIIDGIIVNSSLQKFLPPLKYSITFPQFLNLTDHVGLIESISINGIKSNKTNILINLTQNTDIEVYYISYYYLKIFLNLNGTLISLNNSLVYVNSKPYNYKENIQLSKGTYNISLPNNITLANRVFKLENNSFMISITNNTSIIVNAIPVYKLNIITFGLFGEQKSVSIKVNDIAFQSSNVTLYLAQGEYNIIVASIYSQSEKIYLDRDLTLVFYVAEEILLIPIILFIALPIFFLVRKPIFFKLKKWKIVLDCSIAFLVYIVIPYYGILTFSTILIQKPIIFYQLEDLLLFGLPIVIVKALKSLNKYALVFEAVSIILVSIYTIFIIGRAIYGEFGTYSIEYLSLFISINIASYVLIATIINAFRGFVNFLSLYHSKK